MKILILGAAGNLGCQLRKIFEQDNEVIPWDREDIDITDKELITRKIKELSPAVIINAAAYNAVDKCEDDEKEAELAVRLNTLAPGYLAEAAIETDALLIHYSSDYVFDGKVKAGYDETAATKPLQKYGKTKADGEQELISRSGKRLRWYLIRTSKLFGPKGESEASKPSFFDLMIKVSQEKTELDVVNSELSCFTYTPDLAAATKRLIDEDYGYGIYHIVNEGPVTWYKAAKELFKLAGIKTHVNAVSSKKYARPAKRPRSSVLLNTKFPKLRTYEEALKEYLELTNTKS